MCLYDKERERVCVCLSVGKGEERNGEKEIDKMWNGRLAENVKREINEKIVLNLESIEFKFC